MFDYLITGAGFAGCVLAERIATQLDKRVLIVEKRNHIGGNAYDYYDENGILIHKYGPHIFHTNARRLWDYIGNFTRWEMYQHNVAASIEGKEIPLPFNLNSISKLFPQRFAEKLEDLLIGQYGYGAKIPILTLQNQTSGDLKFLADFIYKNVFYGYTAKQWGVEPDQIDASVTARVPVFVSRDNRYFQDEWQGIPSGGYTRMFERMINHRNIQILLNADYRSVLELIPFNKIIYTGPIDAYFDYMHGELPYRSLRFELETAEAEYVLPCGTVNYPNDYALTRRTEFKRLTGQKHAKTTIAAEYPEPYRRGENEPYYPIPQPKNAELYRKYELEAEKIAGSTHFVGRLANYRYYNMDQVIAKALTVFEKDICGK
ncbi:UDP-galactopyranose mutase [Ignavibacteria bacterium]|nr:UDP-galactopyranose mutase [Bacteroidota bacterium]MCZ2132160.1 UDP-galactopyranose mutase [Bacteroidota bacterium]